MNKIFVNTDGGSRGNPGPAAIGVVFFDASGKEIHSYKSCIGRATNNEAEYQAIIKALEILLKSKWFSENNIAEKEVGLSEEELINKYHLQEVGEIIPICAKVEMELSDLNLQERKEYLRELGLKESGLEKLIKKAYQILGLQTFLTAGEKEVRAWTIKSGDRAPQAAGAIHTDFEKGFIKAKVVSFDDFVRFEGWKKATEEGKVRLEGKDYIMHEDDVVEFMFSL